jgi:hypothetical protein
VCMCVGAGGNVNLTDGSYSRDATTAESATSTNGSINGIGQHYQQRRHQGERAGGQEGGRKEEKEKQGQTHGL